MSLQRSGTSLPSTVDNTEVGYLDGVTSAIQTQLDGKISTVVANGSILIGNATNVATVTAVGGNCTLVANGALTVSNVGGATAAAVANAAALVANIGVTAAAINTAANLCANIGVTGAQINAAALLVANITAAAANISYTADVTSNIQAQFAAQGGTNAVAVTIANLAGSTVIDGVYADAAGANLKQIGTINITVTTVLNERVKVAFSGAVGGIAATEMVMGYQVDSDTPVVTLYKGIQATVGHDASWQVWTAPLAASAHTIKLMGCRSGGATNISIVGPVNYSIPAFTITQYR